MKLKAVQTFQAVKFHNQLYFYFTPDRKGFEDIEITMLDEAVIRIKSSKDEVLVFPTNVQYAVPLQQTLATGEKTKK